MFGLSSSESVSSAYTDVFLLTSFLRFLVVHSNFVLISLFYAECIVAQFRLSQLEALLQQSHCMMETGRLTNMLKTGLSSRHEGFADGILLSSPTH